MSNENPDLLALGRNTIRQERVPTEQEHRAGADTKGQASKISPIAFPSDCLVGSIGDYARVMSKGSEVPPEFFFAAGLTMLGAIAATKLKLASRHVIEPRLYTILLGRSGLVKKSTALAGAAEFFNDIAGRMGHREPLALDRIPLERICGWSDEDHKAFDKGKLAVVDFDMITGSPGSGEGLMRRFKSARSIVLALDELRMLVSKAAITGSSLLDVITSLFEKTAWEAPIKSAERSSGGADLHLSLVGCCTTETYEDLWTPDAIAIGLLNRLFVVTADVRPRVWNPDPIPQDVLNGLRSHIESQLARLPLEMSFTPEADALAEEWFYALPYKNHVVRIDTIAKRLMLLLALTTDKTVIDEEVVRVVMKIMDYEYSVRVLSDPIDAENMIAKMEEKIRRQLEQRGPMNDRKLRQYTNANRVGGWALKAAINNLLDQRDIAFDPKTKLFQSYVEPPAAAAPTAEEQARAAALYIEYQSWLRSEGHSPAECSFQAWREAGCPKGGAAA